MTKILIIGANGMLGHSLYRFFKKKYETVGISRSDGWCPEIRSGYDIKDESKIESLINEVKPNCILNCVGIIKQVKDSTNKEISIRTNALWPHALAKMAAKARSKLIHFSTDCVFQGSYGNYNEDSFCDSRDLYGLSKYLGEVTDPDCITLRTSIIGHELSGHVSLIDWFLSQKEKCNGYSKAIYSGFPTNSIARIIDEKIFPKLMNGEVSGLYHLSSEPINKYELLKLVSDQYGKKIEIFKEEEFEIDRSLNSDRFRKEFDFYPRSWKELVQEMHELYVELKSEGRGI